MPKLLITTSSFDLDNFSDREIIEEAGYEIILNPHGKRLTEKQVSELLDDQVVGMVAGVEPLTETVLNNAKLLKVISRCGIGLDNVDINTAKRNGISVYNTPDAPTKAVAELTLAHILSLARRISESDRALRQGIWQPLMGSLISQQLIGVIGYGRIGKMVAGLLQAFGARVLVHDILPVSGDEGIETVALDELLSQCDIITLHLPYSVESHHIINAETLALMKSTAYLINVARGNLIDEEALLAALQSKQLGGAALDCFSEEPYTGALVSCNKVQLSAHMGSYAKEARSMMETEACSALVQGLKQHSLL